jgi:hypothetical protein
MRYSKHALIRSQQRGISVEQAEVIVTYGRPFRKPGGAHCARLSSRTRNQLIEYHRRQIRLIESAGGKDVIFDEDTVITIQHHLKRDR